MQTLRLIRSVERSWLGRSHSACPRNLLGGFRSKSVPPGFRHGVAQKRIEHEPSASRSALRGSITTKEVVMYVVIGVDPHKASHTAVANR